MASNLRVDTILPSSGTTLGIGTASGTINFLGNSNITTTGDVTVGGNLGVGGTLTYEDVTNIDSVGLITARDGLKVLAGGANVVGVVTATSFVGGLPITNGADNRVITASSASAIRGESGLTFGGSTLRVEAASPQLMITESDTSTSSRLVMSSGRLYIQIAQQGQGSSTSAGIMYLTGYNNTDASEIHFKANNTYNTGHFHLEDSKVLKIGSSDDFQVEHDGNNTYLANTTGDLVFQNDANIKFTKKTGGVERFRIDSSGRLLFGTTSSTRETSLVIRGNSNSYTTNPGVIDLFVGNTPSNLGSMGQICFGTQNVVGARIDGRADQDWTVGSARGTHLRFLTCGNGSTSLIERLRIDNAGRVIVGGGSYAGGATLAVIGDGNTPNTYSCVAFGRKGANPSATTTLVNLRFNGGAGGTSRGAEIICKAGENNWTDGSSHPTELIFATTKASNTSVTQRFRIDQHGRVDHFSDTNNGYDLHMPQSDGTVAFTIKAGSSGLNDGNVTMRIECDGDVANSNNSYGSISDLTLKENIVDANSQWEDIKAIKVRNFNWKSSTKLSTNKQLGVVAQEIETVSPGLVKEDIDGIKSVKYSILYMKAIKALQEAMAKIETLETKVAALEAG